MDNQSKYLLNLSDSDFLSFLYSERDRENNLSQFQGWNNWALFGAIIAVLCTGYDVIKDNLVELRGTYIFYYVSGFLALFLGYRSYSRIIKRERGIDYAKVRMLKEVVPYVRIVLIFVCSITLALLIVAFDKVNNVFFFWSVVFLLYFAGTIIAVSYRERVVPSYFSSSGVLLPWPKANIGFDALVGGLLGLTGVESFKAAPCPFSFVNFELAACVSSLVVLVYLFFVINTENKVVKRFDAIIDAYLYIGKSKEETCQEIMRNRMGYSVLESCYKEYQGVINKVTRCEEEEKKLNDIIQGVNEGRFKMQDLCSLNKTVDGIIENQEKANRQSKALCKKVSQILKVEPVLEDFSELDALIQANQRYIDISKKVCSKAREASFAIYNAKEAMLNELEEALIRLNEKDEGKSTGDIPKST